MSDHNDQYPPHTGPDTAPAFRGLIVGAVILAIVLAGIVKLTNGHYASAEGAPAAEATK
jgi:hypothetical protein